MPRIDAILRNARNGLEPGEAEALLCHTLDRPRSWLYAHGDDELDDGAAAVFDGLLSRRRAGEPVAYLTGRRGFWRFDLNVAPATLIPRPETELLVELALERLSAASPLHVADLGTGSGAIALALAHERPQAVVTATDASLAALEVARGNAAMLGIGNIAFRHGDWFVPLAGERFDLIASNPPYIADADEHLVRGDLRFEPVSALASGSDGLDAIRTIAAAAPVHLVPGGWLLVEHGFDQGDAVQALFAAAGFESVETAHDLEQRDRVTLGRRPAGAAASHPPR